MPNITAKMVVLRDVIATSDLSWEKKRIPLVLGKDVRHIDDSDQLDL